MGSEFEFAGIASLAVSDVGGRWLIGAGAVGLIG